MSEQTTTQKALEKALTRVLELEGEVQAAGRRERNANEAKERAVHASRAAASALEELRRRLAAAEAHQNAVEPLRREVERLKAELRDDARLASITAERDDWKRAHDELKRSVEERIASHNETLLLLQAELGWTVNQMTQFLLAKNGRRADHRAVLRARRGARP